MAGRVSSVGKPAARRACDRCSSLKTQCDFAHPCSRCRRLGVECTVQRPARRRGRPKRRARVASESHTPDDMPPDSSQRQSQSVSPGASVPMTTDTKRALSIGSISDLLRDVPGRPVDPGMVFALLHRLFPLGDDLGFYGIFFTGVEASLEHHSPGAGQHARVGLDEEAVLYEYVAHPWTPQLTVGFVSVALDINARSLSSLQLGPVEWDKESLRTASLGLLPCVVSHYQPLVTDALILLSFSWTWCFTDRLVHTSLQWYTIARLIFEGTSQNDILRSRTEVGMGIQDLSLSLLCFGKNAPPAPLLSHIPASPEVNTAHPPCSCWGLFGSLRSAFDYVLREPTTATCTWREAYTALENFFYDFPVSLLKLDNVAHLYQAESMIWMHGLFILLYTKRDLLAILLDPKVLTDTKLPHALDHALLLGEILPTLQRLEAHLETLSPATLYFVLVSCVVHAAALLSFSLGDGAAPSSEPLPVPPKLAGSAWIHSRALVAIRDRCQRYDSPLIEEVRKLLDAAYARAVHGLHGADGLDARVLMLYRWKGRGTGILRLDPDTAAAEWEFLQPPDADILGSVPRHETQCHRLLLEVCSPRSRLCEPGYFDLSILV
ncbi:hypothetical protein F5883DRAFT_592085 [Diaporthe sp. PMI_573]|nr:hypothetical protein F5883DRAFT_592085 [Diaporthaceae sp. PMI_573]